MNILILGGTAEARDLADRLVALGHDVTTSLAGRTQAPLMPQGAVRVGGFGGVAGLAAALRAGAADWLVDATHPYAGQISFNAVAAARETGVPLLRILRPAWTPPDGANWIHVETAAEAAAALPTGARVLLTTGHTGLPQFLERDDCQFIVRLIETPALAIPPHARLLQSRPPYGLADEIALMDGERITHLVTKNSGGGQTAAKLDAAMRLGVKVIMIARTAYGPAFEVDSVNAAVGRLSAAG
ncbi:MAG: cobalt-precorrin-6A reductase [Alphaproteobacteria bacterium]|nr:cobalt-precorrin-6A reductase [Alphaproteobacteria bacterium]